MNTAKTKQMNPHARILRITTQLTKRTLETYS
jgi:hypothetical protein